MPEKKKRGAGWTTNDIVRQLRKNVAAGYAKELSNLPFKPKDREKMCSGFADGFNNAIRFLGEMGVITVVDEPDEIDEG